MGDRALSSENDILTLPVGNCLTMFSSGSRTISVAPIRCFCTVPAKGGENLATMRARGNSITGSAGEIGGAVGLTGTGAAAAGSGFEGAATPTGAAGTAATGGAVFVEGMGVLGSAGDGVDSGGEPVRVRSFLKMLNIAALRGLQIACHKSMEFKGREFF